MNWNKEKIEYLLKDKWFGPSPLFLEQTESTNTYAKELCRQGFPHGTVIITEFQTHGRGRLRRKWFSPPGLSILMSVLLSPVSTNIIPAAFNFIATLSVVETANQATSFKAEIKWPNDVLADNKKICGVLSEGCALEANSGMVIVGIGINVNQSLEDIPLELRNTATSLKILEGHDFSREEVLSTVLEKIKTYYDRVQQKGTKSIYHRWLKNCRTPGKQVRIADGARTLYGIVDRIDENGVLYIRTSDNQEIQVVAGDLEYEISASIK